MFPFFLFCLFFGFLHGFEPKPITPYPVLGYKEIPFFDENQKVERTLLIWYPVAPDVIGSFSDNPWDVFKVAKNASLPTKQKRSLIVISHGYSGNPHQLSWLIRGLVENNFFVVAMQHRDLVEGKAHMNHWQRAQDVKTMLDVFMRVSLSKFLEKNKIGFAGFSLGGTTGIWVAGGRSTKLDTLIPGPEFASKEDYVKADEALLTLNKEMMQKDWKESRIKAAFLMAPAWAWLFDTESLKKVTIPVYFLAAAMDSVLVTKNNAGFFAKNIPKSYYTSILGKGNHYLFISALSEKKQKEVSPTGELNFLFQEDVSIDRAWIQAQAVREAVGFFNASLNASYR